MYRQPQLVPAEEDEGEEEGEMPPNMIMGYTYRQRGKRTKMNDKDDGNYNGILLLMLISALLMLLSIACSCNTGGGGG